ncbi:MAG: ABC transporter ATP-binding protein [Anaerolineae bacterium]|nr:ABC transporter ATP-binding protein [Anaerolineae bacterium]
MTDATPLALIELRGITKYFPGVVANDDIFLTIRGGEIQSLLGENGAGKSTLLNILSGMIRPDRGQILIDGQVVTLTSPHEALKWGIGTVYQHFTLVPTLSVIENVMLGRPAGFVLNLRQAEQRLQALLDDVGLAVSPQVEVRHLSLGQQQRVEIIKALFRGSRVLLLDEPTSVLTPAEVSELFAILRRLKARGVAVIFITHKLEEALTLSDRITVLRQGQRVGEVGPDRLARQDRAAITEHILKLMFGTASSLPPSLAVGREPLKSKSSLSAEPVCILKEVTALSDREALSLSRVSLELYPGEILGIAGVDGNGQKELGEVLAGQRRVNAGQIVVNGVNIANGGTAAARRAGVGYLTDDRLGEAGVPALSVAENAVLKVVNQRPFSRWTLLDRGAVAAYAVRLIRQFKIVTPGPWARLGTLSGGNIQKLLLARELAAQPKILVCNKPTQGLDVLTAQFVLQTLRAQAERGTAVLLISAELDELLACSDRIGVMYNGRLLDVVPRAQTNEAAIGRLMLGLAQ